MVRFPLSVPVLRLRILLFCIALGGCSHTPLTRQTARTPTGVTRGRFVDDSSMATSVMRGRFVDDYGNAFEISDSVFSQLPHGRFRIVEWHASEQFVVAQNDTTNPRDAGLWTRIDWIVLTDMAPYTWGFCLTAYRAPTRAAARETPSPDRRTPRTGCNGFPFSRMRTATADSGGQRSERARPDDSRWSGPRH